MTHAGISLAESFYFYEPSCGQFAVELCSSMAIPWPVGSALDREEGAYVATYVGMRRHGTLATFSRRRVTSHVCSHVANRCIKPVTHAFTEAARAVEAHIAPSGALAQEYLIGKLNAKPRHNPTAKPLSPRPPLLGSVTCKNTEYLCASGFLAPFALNR